MRFEIPSVRLLLIAAITLGGSRSLSAAEAHRASTASSQHAWKAQLREAKLVHVKAEASGPGPVPAHFGDLSPQARLAYLLARYNVDPVRFDHYHPKLGPYLGTDERLRAGQAQGASGMNGLFPNTPLTRYLHYRRNLDPKRFDHYHPALGALLAEDDRLRAIGSVAGEIIPPVTTPPTTPATPGTPSGESPSGGQGLNPESVPEPASLLLLLVGTAAAGAVRLRRRGAAKS